MKGGEVMAKKAINDTKHLFKRGNVWWIQAMRNGERIIQTTGEADIEKARLVRDDVLNPLKLRNERKRAEAVLAKVEGIDKQLAKIENETPALGILAAWKAYCAAPNRPDSGKRTMDGYESQFGRFTDWMNTHYPDVTELRGITQQIAFQFSGDLAAQLTPNSFNKYLVLFRRMWEVLQDTDNARLTLNPWNKIKNKLLATHSRRELTIEELTKVCASVDGEMRILFAVGLYCGLRLGDAVQLKWSNVDLVRRVLIVVPGKTARRSNGKVLQIPLHHSLHSMLADTSDEERKGYVMPELANLYQYKQTKGAFLVKRVREVFEGCGIETGCKVEGYSRMGVDVGFHSLRHSFVSLSANAGSSLAAVQAVVGHSNPAMTRHYLHQDTNTVKNAVNALPDVTHVKTMPDGPDATGAILDGILGQLDKLSVEQLATLAEKVRETTDKRTYKQLTGAASAVAE